MIDIATLGGKSKEEIKQMVLAEKTNDYAIYVPKSTDSTSDDNDIAFDYAFAAYAGQLIFNAGSHFSYDEIEPDDFESILFEISSADADRIAEAVYEVSLLYVNEPAAGEAEPPELVENFLYEVEEEKITPACPYFLEVYEEYAEEEEDEEEE